MDKVKYIALFRENNRQLISEVELSDRLNDRIVLVDGVPFEYIDCNYQIDDGQFTVRYNLYRTNFAKIEDLRKLQ